MTAATRTGGFETGVRDALAAMLASPYFLYRIEGGNSAGGTYTLNDLELASRLSFFLWGSIPDDELLAVAMRNELGQPAMLDAPGAAHARRPEGEIADARTSASSG